MHFHPGFSVIYTFPFLEKCKSPLELTLEYWSFNLTLYNNFVHIVLKVIIYQTPTVQQALGQALYLHDLS
jgi:hypothetical protein